ncbi:MAG: B12-binding domain-containing radical SAM protein [Candidatus Odinarchaeota archaeon]
MKILLINPPSPQEQRYFTNPPIGLLSLASVLKEKNHEVQILDLYTFGGDHKELINSIKKQKFEVVGITGMSFQHNTILRMAKLVKIVDPNIITILGGAHASALPELLLKDKNVDFILRGEADYSLPAFLDVINKPNEWNRIAGLCFKTDDDITISPLEIIDNIDSLPIPAWDLIRFQNYSGSPHGFFYQREPIGQIITSRGCPYSCTFCAAHTIHSKKWRAQSSKRVIAELDYLVKILGIKELHIEDDNFSVNLQRAKDIFKEIIRRKYNLSIAFPNGLRIDRLDDELLQLMKIAGVYSMTFGIESGSERILRRIKKSLKLDFLETQLKRIKKYGFFCQGFFIIGFPYENKDDVIRTIHYSLKIDLDGAFFGTYVPLPGSEDFNELVSKNKINIETMNWDLMFSMRAQNMSYYLNAKDIKTLIRLANIRFYLRIKIFLGILKRIRGYKHVLSFLQRLRELI